MNDVDWGGFENNHYDTYYIIVWADLKPARYSYPIIQK